MANPTSTRVPHAFPLLLSCALAACGAGPDEAGSRSGAEGAVSQVAEPLTLPAGAVPYRGVNLSGADFGSALPGREGYDYVFPDTDDVDYYVSRGMNTFRIGFRWERLQRMPFRPFDTVYFARLDALVRHATSRGAHVVLNPQNFARYYGRIVGSATAPNPIFANLWWRLAVQYRANPSVLFGLVNEPNTMPTEQWVSAANAAIAAVRAAGAPNIVLVPGNGWSGAHSWYDSWYGTPNATAMLGIRDPRDNLLFEVHQYLDSDSSGTSPSCVSATIGSQRMAGFVQWLRTNRKKGFLGELAGGRNATCYAAVRDMLTYVAAQSDVLVGWTWWGGGPWWGDAYPFALDPSRGADRPQMAILLPFLAR